jgi:hypothetical protein
MKRIILPAILSAVCVYANAQDAFRNNGNLRIHSGGSFSARGSFTNASTAVLVNNGNLYIGGSVTNSEASMSAGTGTLYLNGSSAQGINGTQVFRTFNLNSNNTAGITINNNLHVSGAHAFTSGLIATSATPNYLIYEAGSSHSGSSDAAHVNGWVKKNGNTDFVFPVGNASYLRSIALTGLSASSEFDVRYSLTTPNTSQIQDPVKNMDPNEYWTVSRVSGGSASVAMNWDHTKVPIPNWHLSNITVATRTGSVWTDGGGTATGSVTGTGTITSSSQSAFNLFSFGSKGFPVPLTLIKFTAAWQGSYTRIDWITTSEQNVSHFIVERSDDGVNFYSVGRVSARNSGNLENYFLNDTRSINGSAWYRLRSVDLDTKESLSKIVRVKLSGSDEELILVTNPVKNKIVLRAGKDLGGNFHYGIYQLQGQVVQQGSLIIRSGETHELMLNVQPPPGTYLLRVTNGTQKFEYKLVQL